MGYQWMLTNDVASCSWCGWDCAEQPHYANADGSTHHCRYCHTIEGKGWHREGDSEPFMEWAERSDPSK